MGFLKRLFGTQDAEPKPKEKEVENERWRHFPTDENDIAFLKTNVAGCNFRLKKADARKVYNGNAMPDPDNPANPKAIALISDDGKHIGYIPDDRLREYYDIFEGRKPRFYGAVGIFTNDQGKRKLFGKVMVVDVPESDDGRLFDLAQKQLDFMMAEFSTE